MKKPSAYFPLYGNDFFEAIAGYPDAVGMAYLRALWHYWNHTSCEGLPDDDEYLRRVCHCDPADWERIRAILFDNRYHFRLVEGLWHQPRCRKVWLEAVELYEKKVKQTEAATRARTRNVT
jgi:uncharacterized protein YdaU (DUF1376 family)